MLQTKLAEIRIRIKEEINKHTILDTFDLILSSDTVEEFVEGDYILNDICDRLYREYDCKTNMDIDFYGILTKVRGIQDDHVTRFVNQLQDHEFNVYFQYYLQYRIHRLDELLQEDSRRTKLSVFTKELLEIFFQEATHQDQEKVLRTFYKNDRKDLLFIVSKEFGVSLRNFQLSSPVPQNSDSEDEVHIEIPEEMSEETSNTSSQDSEPEEDDQPCHIWSEDIL